MIINYNKKVIQASRLCSKDNGQDPQEIYGCYTIADTWSFIRAKIDRIDSEIPVLTCEASREYSSKIKAEIIFKILKQIIANYV